MKVILYRLNALKRKSLNVEECGHEIRNEFHWSQLEFSHICLFLQERASLPFFSVYSCRVWCHTYGHSQLLQSRQRAPATQTPKNHVARRRSLSRHRIVPVTVYYTRCALIRDRQPTAWDDFARPAEAGGVYPESKSSDSSRG